MSGPHSDDHYVKFASDDNVIPLDPEARKIELAPLPEVPGVWAKDLGDLCEAPPPRSWFLTDVRTDKGLLLAGKVFLLVADGGVGKGFFLMLMAVCTALGINLFGTFRPKEGHVALFVAEDDEEECRHRLWRIMNSMHLDRDERRRVGERLKFFPMTGEEVNLLTLDKQGNVERTRMFDAIVAKLKSDAEEGGFEWRFVAVDPLVSFAGGKAEIDNAVANKFMTTLAAISNGVPGKPAVACAHHESKVGRSNARTEHRGVTALRNGVRAVFGLKPFETEDGLRGVRLENDKNNCARKAGDVWLVRMENEPMPDGRWLETAGALRLATDDEREKLVAVAGVRAGDPVARQKERETKKEEAKIEKAQTRRAALLQCLPVEPEHLTTAEVEEAMERAHLGKIGKGTSWELRQLADLKLAKDLGTGNRRKWCRPAGGQ